ncbi:MAG: hypothetical protein ACK5N8_06670 [Alphaproteobacteria bacterium]
MEIIQQLRNIPAFISFEKGVKENLNINNSFVRDFKPEKKGMIFDRDSNKYFPYELSEEEVEDKAIEKLLSDNSGCFEDFIHEDKIRDDLTELARILIKEILEN